MIHPESFRVTKRNGPRPAGNPGECFYCHQKLNTEHTPTCVLRKRTVIVTVAIDVLMEAGAEYTVEEILQRLNHSSYCKSNITAQIAQADGDVENANSVCLCDVASFTFKREATINDEQRHFYKNEDF